ncbi:hypothetical protein PENSPDRAFT_659420 [Peniophora sp. CONT]|nr:hypothetical protein PENSPDRAFT_659420 [Peniophora sp. CONT]
MPMHDVSMNGAALVGSWVAAVIYGLNVPLYILCIRILGKTNRILTMVTSMHIILATAHSFVTLAYLVRGFLQLPTRAESDVYYAVQSTSLHLGQFWLYFFLIMVGDGIMAWRCYVVSKRSNFVAAFFVLLLVVYFACDVTNLVKIAQTQSEEQFFEAFAWMTAVFTLSLGIQFAATFLIIWKIWANTLRRSAAPTHSSNLAIIWMLVESGIVLTGASASVLIMFRMKLNAGALVAPIHAQLSFFIPASIIARAARLRHAARQDQVLPGSIRFAPFRHGGSGGSGTHGSSSQRSSKPLGSDETHKSTAFTISEARTAQRVPEYEPVTTLKAVH